MNVVLLTSNSLRHKYIAASLAKAFELSLLIIEKKSQAIQDTSSYTTKDANLMAKHFKARAESEKDFFGGFEDFGNAIPTLQLNHGQVNSESVLHSIAESNPELIILFGTSIIRNPLLSQYKGRIVNLHLGLSPYYKGSATNLYPYLFDEPECIGATIHLATEKVDEGAILHQFRPEIKPTDTLHDIGNKVIKRAGTVLPTILQASQDGKILPVNKKGKGRLCRNNNITPEVLREINENFEQGMIEDYLENKKVRDGRRPIVQQI